MTSSSNLATASTHQSNFFLVIQHRDQGIGSGSKAHDSYNKKISVNKSKDIRKHSDKSFDVKSACGQEPPNHPAQY